MGTFFYSTGAKRFFVFVLDFPVRRKNEAQYEQKTKYENENKTKPGTKKKTIAQYGNEV